jgi:hypothetical protein
MHSTLTRLTPLNLREATAALLPSLPYAPVSVHAIHDLMFFQFVSENTPRP